MKINLFGLASVLLPACFPFPLGVTGLSFVGTRKVHTVFVWKYHKAILYCATLPRQPAGEKRECCALFLKLA